MSGRSVASCSTTYRCSRLHRATCRRRGTAALRRKGAEALVSDHPLGAGCGRGGRDFAGGLVEDAYERGHRPAAAPGSPPRQHSRQAGAVGAAFSGSAFAGGGNWDPLVIAASVGAGAAGVDSPTRFASARSEADDRSASPEAAWSRKRSSSTGKGSTRVESSPRRLRRSSAAAATAARPVCLPSRWRQLRASAMPGTLRRR